MTTPVTSGPRRCAIYTRKSTTIGLEKDFTSLDAQRETCEAFIRSQVHAGWVALEEHYDDGGFTGANLERPAFQKLMHDVESGAIDVVVVYKIDRLSRSLLDFARVMERMSKHGVGLVSITQNFSTTSAMGRLTLNMLMSFAEYEREVIAERTRDKLAAARRRGKWTGGLIPLGYQLEGGKLVVVEDEAVVVREIFSLYLERRSLVHVIEQLRERGRKTKTYVSKEGNVRAAKAWTKHAVLRVLRNPVMAGLVHSDGTFFPGEHDAIVDVEEFRRVQALLAGKPAPHMPVVRNPAYVLRGVLRCGSCGAAMIPASTHKGGRKYRYYRCLTRDKQGASACPAHQLPARAIEDMVVGYIRQFASTPNVIEEVQHAVSERVGAEIASRESERKRLVDQIAKLAARERTLSEEIEAAAARAPHARAALLERLDQAVRALRESQQRLSLIDTEMLALDDARREANWAARILSDFDDLWKVATPETQARLVSALVDWVEVHEQSGEVRVQLIAASVPGAAEVHA